MSASSELTSGPALLPCPPAAQAAQAVQAAEAAHAAPAVPPPAPRPMPRRAGWAMVIGAALVASGAALHGTAADRAIFLAINAWPGTPEALASLFSVAGLGVSVFVCFCAWPRRPPGLLASLLLAFVLGTLLVHGLKYGLRWPRPGAVLPAEEVHRIGLLVSGRAMPSGHATTVFAVWALLLGSLPRSAWAALGGGLLALGVTWSRVAVGAHWPGDVLVGAGLGLWVGTAALGLSSRWALATRWDRPGLRLALRCALLACALYLLIVPTGYPAADPLPWLLAAAAGWAAWRAQDLSP